MKRKRMYLASAIIFLMLVGISLAVVPPPPVNQNIGIYDTRVDKLTEPLCRNCHNTTFLGGVPTRHHFLLSSGAINPTNGQPFGCMDCHPVVSGPNGQSVLIDRNCINCHNGSAFYANPAAINITRPHHIDTAYDQAGIGQPARGRLCSACHGSFVADYNDSHYIPSYETSFMITPYADFKAQNASTGRLWGGCLACHNNATATPAILTNHDTHHGALLGWGREGGKGHQTDRTPGMVCTWCHLSTDVHGATVTVMINGVPETVLELRNSTMMAADAAAGKFEPGTTVPINGTSCEKCHSVQSIHNIQYNYPATNGQLGNGHIGTNWDCMGCHASWDAGALYPVGAIIPVLDSVDPSVLTAGTATTLTITGVNFVNDAYTSVVSVDGVSYTPTSITDTQIVVNISALTAGVHTLQLVKGDADSKLATLTVVTPVDVLSAKITAKSKTSTQITITGTGFGPQPSAEFQDLGVFVTTSSHGNSKKATTVVKATVVSWSDTKIVVTVSSASVGTPVTVKALDGTDSAALTG